MNLDSRQPPRVALSMGTEIAEAFFPPAVRHRLAAAAPLADEVLTDLDADTAQTVLRDIEVLVTGWGAPAITPDVLDAAPALRAVIHSAGSVRGHVTDACWDRGVAVSSAAAANAEPVAEFTLAQILLAGKDVWRTSREFTAARHRRRRPDLADGRPAPSGSRAERGAPVGFGGNGLVVGLVGASMIGRRVAELLRPFDLDVRCYDPYATADEVAALGAAPVSMEDLFATCEVVSVHAPLLPETVGMISRELLQSMRPGALLINTARGALIDGDALTEVLAEGRIRAVLDVTDPEPPPPESPLWTLPNVLLTPHLAGAQGSEVDRLIDLACTEVERWFTGADLRHLVPATERSIRA